LRLGNDFLDTTPGAQYINGQTDKLDVIKIKVCSSKDTSKKMKRDTTFWEKIFAKRIPDSNDLYLEYIKNFSNKTIRKITQL